MNLPDRNISRLVTVADFLESQHETIAAAINQARIPHQFEFHVYQDTFRLYVPEENLEAAREICESSEQSIMLLDRTDANESPANFY